MIVTGLNSNRYLVGNPIPINMKLEGDVLFNMASYIEMTITKVATHVGDVTYTLPVIRLYPSPNGITIDLMTYIKGLMPKPYIPTATYTNPVPNYQRFNITFNENQTGTSNVFLSKTFIRGFKRFKSNSPITVGYGQILTTPKLPQWGTYPIAFFWIDTNNNIQSTTVVEEQYIKKMKVPTACNPFYVRFLNSLGGYSFWMFNSWDWKTKSKELGVIENNTNVNNTSLGFTEENTVTVDARVKREFYPIIRDLLVSPVVQVYKTPIVQVYGSQEDWLQIQLKGDDIQENNYEDMIEVTLTFDLMLNVNPSVIW